MVSITIKGLKDGCHIYASYDDFQAFIKELEQRLHQWNLKGPKEVFFHLSSESLAERLLILQLCNEYQLYISGFNQVLKKPKVQMIEANLRSGQTYSFLDDIVIFGNIEEGCEVIAKGNIYVLGGVYGNVDLFYQHCVLYASKINGNIRICDSYYHNLTSSAPLKIYYKNAMLQIEKVKEEQQWAKRLRLPVEKVA